MSDPSVWRFHEKYQRNYRDFYSNEDGKWYRQYDDLQGAKVEIPPVAFQQTVAQQPNVPRTVQKFPYSNLSGTAQSAPAPSITRDPSYAQRGPTPYTYSLAPQINQSHQTSTSPAAEDNIPVKEPAGLSHASTETQRSEQEDYVLTSGTGNARGKSQTRRDQRYLEQKALRQRVEVGVHKERATSRTRALPSYKNDGNSQRRGSRSTQPRPEQTRKSSFSRAGKFKGADLSGQFEGMTMNPASESAVEEREDEQEDRDQNPNLLPGSRSDLILGGGGINQTENSGNDSPIDSIPVDEDEMRKPQYKSNVPITYPLTNEGGEGTQPSYTSHQNVTSASPTLGSGGLTRSLHGYPQTVSSAGHTSPNATRGSQYVAVQSFRSQVEFAEPIHGQSDYSRSFDFATGGETTSSPAAQPEPESGPTTGEPPPSEVYVDSPDLVPEILSGLGKKGYEIKGSQGREEPLDKNYFKRDKPKQFLKVGRVFAMLWHENVGRDGTIISGPNISMGPFREGIYTSVRRMIVVKEGNGFCWCLPVSTYNGRATTKPGLNPKSHAIVYMAGSRPGRLQGEIGMNKQSLSVDCVQGQKLDPLSRVNFDKVYTVEHNVKVMNIGKISEASLPKLVGYWRIHRDQ